MASFGNTWSNAGATAGVFRKNIDDAVDKQNRDAMNRQVIEQNNLALQNLHQQQAATRRIAGMWAKGAPDLPMPSLPTEDGIPLPYPQPQVAAPTAPSGGASSPAPVAGLKNPNLRAGPDLVINTRAPGPQTINGRTVYPGSPYWNDLVPRVSTPYGSANVTKPVRVGGQTIAPMSPAEGFRKPSTNNLAPRGTPQTPTTAGKDAGLRVPAAPQAAQPAAQAPFNAQSAPTPQLEAALQQAAQLEKFPPQLLPYLRALIQTESQWGSHPKVASKIPTIGEDGKRHYGLMQVKEDWFGSSRMADLGLNDQTIYDPVSNIRAGMRIINDLLARTNNNLAETTYLFKGALSDAGRASMKPAVDQIMLAMASTDQPPQTTQATTPPPPVAATVAESKPAVPQTPTHFGGGAPPTGNPLAMYDAMAQNYYKMAALERLAGNTQQAAQYYDTAVSNTLQKIPVMHQQAVDAFQRGDINPAVYLMNYYASRQGYAAQTTPDGNVVVMHRGQPIQTMAPADFINYARLVFDAQYRQAVISARTEFAKAQYKLMGEITLEEIKARAKQLEGMGAKITSVGDQAYITIGDQVWMITPGSPIAGTPGAVSSPSGRPVPIQR